MARNIQTKFITHHRFIAAGTILVLWPTLLPSWYAYSLIVPQSRNGVPQLSFSSFLNNHRGGVLLIPKIHNKHEEDGLSFKSETLSIDDDVESASESNADNGESLASFLNLTGANDETRRTGIASFLRSRVDSHRTNHPQHAPVEDVSSGMKIKEEVETVIATELNGVKAENDKLLKELKAESLARVKAESTIKKKDKDLQKSEEKLTLRDAQIENERSARVRAERAELQALEAKARAEKFIQASGAALRTVEERAKIEAGARFIAEKEIDEEKEKNHKLLDRMELEAKEREHIEEMMRRDKKKLEEATLQLDSVKKQLKKQQDALKKVKQKRIRLDKEKTSIEKLVEEKEKALHKAKVIAKTETKRIRKKLGREHMARLEAEEEARVAIEAKDAAHALIDIEVDARRTAEKTLLEEARLRADMDATIQAKDADYNKLLGRLEGKHEDWLGMETKLHTAQEELKDTTAKVAAAQFQLDKEVAARVQAEKDLQSANEAKASFERLVKEKEDALCKERAHAKSETKVHEQLLEKAYTARKKAEKEAKTARDEKAAIDKSFQRKETAFENVKNDFETRLKRAQEELENANAKVITSERKFQAENIARLKAEEEAVTINKAKVSLEQLLKEKEKLLEKEKSSTKSDISVLEQLLQKECAAHKKAQEDAQTANDAKTKLKMLFEKEGDALDKARQKVEEEAMARVAAEAESREEKMKSFTLLEELKAEKEAKNNIEDRARKARKELQKIEGKVAVTNSKLEDERAARIRAEKNVSKIKKAKTAIENSMKPLEEALRKALASAEEAEGTLHEYRVSMDKAEIKANVDKKKYEKMEKASRKEREARLKAEEEAAQLRESNAASEEKAKTMEEDLKKALAEGKSISREKIILAETKLKELTKIARAEADARKNVEEELREAEKELQKYKEMESSTNEKPDDSSSLETKLQNQSSKTGGYDELSDLESKLALFKNSFDADLDEQNEQDDIDGAYMFGPQH